jgi:hypothetical protein
MRKQFITSIIILMCFMAVVATKVTAQSVQRLEVNIPFQFVLSGRTLRSGKYAVEPVDPAKQNVLMLKNTDEGTRLLTLVQRVEKENPSEASSLVFLRREGKYYLFQIWRNGDSNGNEVPLTDEVRRDRKSNNSSLVQLRASGP